MLSRPGVSAEVRPDAAPKQDTRDSWVILNDPAAAPALVYRAWLAVQCGAIQGAANGALFLLSPTGTPIPVAQWAATARSADLSRLAIRALADKRTAIAWARQEGPRAPGATEDAIMMLVAQPLGPPDAAYGAVAVAVSPGKGINQADPEGVARQLQGGAGWLDMVAVREGWKAADADMVETRLALQRAASAMDAVAVMGEHPRLIPSAMAIVNEVASRLGCSRVSLGVVRRGRVRLQAMSHTAVVKRSGAIAGLVEDAMEEALVQAAPVAYPAVPGVAGISISHQALARGTAVAVPTATVTVLLPGCGAEMAGALTLERQGAGFDTRTLELVVGIGALIGPMLALHVRGDRWFAGRIVDAPAVGLRALVGPRRPALKLAALAVIVGVLGMSFASCTHRVSAKAMLEGEVQRAAVAPYDGFVVQGPARAGDRVRAGDLLAALDDRELVLERVKAWAEREKLLQRRQEAMAKHDRSGAAVLGAQVDQAQAVLDLAEDKLRRARILAPVDGVVVSGDLSQMLGSPVERGRVLFEVAPLDRFRLAIQVEDGNVRWVQPGQEGTLRLSSMPAHPVRFTVVQRTPVATTEDNHNVFRVEAALIDPPEGLRPGMEGVAKVEIGSANLLWVWLHPVVEAARLAVWKWLP